MFVQTQKTPNPNSLKFLPGKKVSSVGPVEFLKKDKGKGVPLAEKILSLEGTQMVFFGEDFITVKKEDNLNWNDLKRSIISEINDFYLSGNEIVIEKNLENADEGSENAPVSDVVKKLMKC